MADVLNLNSALGENGMAPSILNGYGSNPAFLIGAYAMAIGIGSFFELNDPKVDKENPANKGWDPLNLKDLRHNIPLMGGKTVQESRFEMEVAEIKHARVAMMAITGFIMQEIVTKIPVVEETPQFF